jgi:hypothetical protein
MKVWVQLRKVDEFGNADSVVNDVEEGEGDSMSISAFKRATMLYLSFEYALRNYSGQCAFQAFQ